MMASDRRQLRGRLDPWYGFRGYTLHARPGSTERGAAYRAGLRVSCPTSARRGPVAGCSPRSCHHRLPHSTWTPAQLRDWQGLT